jgi:hypothetical protein
MCTPNEPLCQLQSVPLLLACRMGDPHSALLDAEASLQRDDKWIKGYYYK